MLAATTTHKLKQPAMTGDAQPHPPSTADALADSLSLAHTVGCIAPPKHKKTLRQSKRNRIKIRSSARIAAFMAAKDEKIPKPASSTRGNTPSVPRPWHLVAKDVLMHTLVLEFPDGTPNAIDMRANAYAHTIGTILQCLQQADCDHHGNDHPKSPAPKTAIRARKIIQSATHMTIHPHTLIKTPPFLPKYHQFYRVLTSNTPQQSNAVRIDSVLWDAIAGLANDLPPKARLKLVKIAAREHV
jgi:hypothetical protein